MSETFNILKWLYSALTLDQSLRIEFYVGNYFPEF